MAVAMIATMAPRGHISKTTVTLRPDGHYVLGVGTSEFGNGTTTVHTQIVSTVLGTGVDRMTMTNSDTDGAVYGELRDDQSTTSRPVTSTSGGRRGAMLICGDQSLLWMTMGVRSVNAHAWWSNYERPQQPSHVAVGHRGRRRPSSA